MLCTSSLIISDLNYRLYLTDSRIVCWHVKELKPNFYFFLCKWAKPQKFPLPTMCKTVCAPSCILKRNCVKHRSSDRRICSVSPLRRKALLSNQQQVRSARELMLWELYWQVFVWFDSSPLENFCHRYTKKKKNNTPLAFQCLYMVSVVLKPIIINQSSITSQAQYRQNGPISCCMLDNKWLILDSLQYRQMSNWEPF